MAEKKSRESKTLVIEQKAGDSFHHDGSLQVHGDCEKPPVKHQIQHATHPQQPLVHMVCWDADHPCECKVSGEITLKGDEKAPLHVRMAHHFANDHHQTHKLEPLDHALKVNTALAEPIHHALQMRTPLQLRFCNPWHIASDYVMELRMGKNRVMSLRLTGATVATPQQCEDDPCPQPKTTPPGNP